MIVKTVDGARQGLETAGHQSNQIVDLQVCTAKTGASIRFKQSRHVQAVGGSGLL